MGVGDDLRSLVGRRADRHLMRVGDRTDGATATAKRPQLAEQIAGDEQHSHGRDAVGNPLHDDKCCQVRQTVRRRRLCTNSQFTVNADTVNSSDVSHISSQKA